MHYNKINKIKMKMRMRMKMKMNYNHVYGILHMNQLEEKDGKCFIMDLMQHQNYIIKKMHKVILH